MWPLKMTARGVKFRWRWFRKSIWRCSGHFRTIWGYFGPVLGRNFKRQISHVTTQNDRRRSEIPMDMVSEVNFKMLLSFRDHLGPFATIWDYLRTFGTILGRSNEGKLISQTWGSIVSMYSYIPAFVFAFAIVFVMLVLQTCAQLCQLIYFPFCCSSVSSLLSAAPVIIIITTSSWDQFFIFTQ